ncbi:ATP dependent DNA ligase domain-containing protein [Trichophaea hybrida]|nr:ATP dependent DNA ligase domain-containing protein [Trichophaea hybrida]
MPILEDDVNMQDAAVAQQAENDNAGLDKEGIAGNLDLLTEQELEQKFPNRPRNQNETFPFHVLYTKLFEPLLANSKKKTGIGLRGTKDLKPHEIRRNIIDEFISRWRSEVGPDIFPAFRLILCEKDRDRNVYHLKEQKIGKLLVKVMKINKDSDDGYALIHWKQPGSWAKSAGDFALRCYDVIKKRPMRTIPGDLTITQVNDMLDRLSQTQGEDKQLPIMTEFYNNMCAEELLWLIRIILKQMKVGATEKTFFDAWHPDADALFNVCSSLRRVCWELWDPNFRMEDDTKGVNLMSCFQPQLAQFQKRSMADVIKSMQGQGFWIEEKLDGERMQMHFDNGEFRWWSRKAKEYTHLYGSSWENGSLSRFTQDAFDKRVSSIILDGEMITWDPKLDCIVGFGTLKTAAIETSNNPYGNQHRPVYRVFDILYLNGQSLLHYSLEDRRRALDSVVKNVYRRLEIHPYLVATTVDEIESELRKVIAASSEGLVIKNPRSVYQLNDRNDDWVKVKPEYMTEFGESLDCLVIGGYWGSGKRGNILSSYLCGLRVDGNALAPGANPMKYYSFFKVGGGFTANDYSTIAHQTEDAWVDWDSKNPPDFIELADGSREFERPDVWIHPEKSFVVEVKAASMATTDQFRMNLTLRFARFKRLRPDKNWETALSIQSFLQLQAEAFKEVEGKRMDVEQRRGGRKRIKTEFNVAGDDTAPQFAASLEPPPPGKPLFEGHAFYVMSETATRRNKKTKAEIEALVKAHGGKFYQNEKAEPQMHIIGDRNTVKISALKKKGGYDLIRPSWIFDCIHQHEAERKAGREGGYILPLEPGYMFHATPETQKKGMKNIDPWGDSYARDVEIDDLRELLEHMQGDFDRSLALSFRDSVDLQGGEMDMLPGWMFKDCVVYADEAMDSAGLTITRNIVDFAGGKMSKGLEEGGITHVVVGVKTKEERLQEIRGIISKWSGKIPRIVTTDWVDESIKAKTLLDEERFGPAPLAGGVGA